MLFKSAGWKMALPLGGASLRAVGGGGEERDEREFFGRGMRAVKTRLQEVNMCLFFFCEGRGTG